MTDPALIFREEALRSREAQPPPASTPRVSPRWIARAYWALLVLVAVGLTAGALVRVPQVARGPAVVRDGVTEAAVPAFFASDLHPGMPLRLTLRGRGEVTVAITGTGPDVASAAAASSVLDTPVSGVGPAPGALLVVRAGAPPHAAGGAEGTASVQVGSQPLIVTLVTGLVSGATDG
jgi:hypothetical protein